MSNIIDGIEFGMGYEQATKWEPGLSIWSGEKWLNPCLTSQAEMDDLIGAGARIRRPLPILANHPEAIPLEPGEVLQVGDRGLTRDGRDTGELEYTREAPQLDAGLILHSRTLNLCYMPNGSFWPSKTKSEYDIIARLPKVAKEAEPSLKDKAENLLKEIYRDREEILKAFIAKHGVGPEDVEQVEQRTENGVVWFVRVKPEAEKAKEEKVEIKIPAGYEEITSYRECALFTNLSIKGHGWHEVNQHTVVMPQPGILYIAPIQPREEKVEEDRVQIGTLFPKLADVAKAVIENPKIMAEVQRQEEAKRIGPGDWAFDKIKQCVFEVKKVGRHQVVGIEMAFSDDACEEAHELSECRKLNLPPEVIAALNAEIDAKAGG